MSRHCLLLIMPLFLIVYDARAESTTPGKTDAFTELQNSFVAGKQDEETERIKQLDEVTGLEWLQMALGERQDHILASMFILKQHGVDLRKSLNDYFNVLEEKLHSIPGLYNTDLTQILASLVYEKEPRNRQALDKYRNKPSVKSSPAAA